MTHKQDVCKKSGSSPHKVNRWSTEGLSMYNVNKLDIFRITGLPTFKTKHFSFFWEKSRVTFGKPSEPLTAGQGLDNSLIRCRLAPISRVSHQQHRKTPVCVRSDTTKERTAKFCRYCTVMQ